MPQWVCAGCQGKRMRAPSQAVVQAAIEAAREREEAAQAGAARRPAKRTRLSGLAGASTAGAGSGRAHRGGAAAAAAKAGAAPGGTAWAEAALGVLAKVSTAYCSGRTDAIVYSIALATVPLASCRPLCYHMSSGCSTALTSDGICHGLVQD